MQSQKPPKNCREAFTADGDQVFAGRYYSSENTRPKFLSKDVDSEIRLVSVQALLWFSDCSLWDVLPFVLFSQQLFQGRIVNNFFGL